MIALVQRGMLLAKLTNPSGVRFELEKLNWLGNLNSETGLVLAWHTAPHRRAQDLFEQELIVGGQTGVDPEITPRLYNSLIGTKFKIVTGYNGTAEIALAIERGEVQGIGDWSWASLKKQRPDWLRDKKVTLLMQGALQRDPDLPDLPSALDFVKSDADRKVMELFFTQKTIARPVIAPPGLPAERLAGAARGVRGARGGCAVLGRRGKIRSGCRADCGRSRRQGGYADHRHAGRAWPIASQRSSLHRPNRGEGQPSGGTIDESHRRALVAVALTTAGLGRPPSARTPTPSCSTARS